MDGLDRLLNSSFRVCGLHLCSVVIYYRDCLMLHLLLFSSFIGRVV